MSGEEAISRFAWVVHRYARAWAAPHVPREELQQVGFVTLLVVAESTAFVSLAIVKKAIRRALQHTLRTANDTVSQDETAEERTPPAAVLDVAISLDACSPLERRALALKFGLDGERECGRRDLARMLGVTQRVADEALASGLARVRAQLSPAYS